MKMTYKDFSDTLWFNKDHNDDVKILRSTEKSVFVECTGITFRLRRSEIVKGAEIVRSGYREYSYYYILITVEEVDE